MYSNGSISFGGTGAVGSYVNQNLSTVTGNSTYSYSMFPLWTDLYPNPSDPANSGTFYLANSANRSATFGWYNMAEYGVWNYNNNFEAQIYGNGNFYFSYNGISINYHPVTIGFTGDMTKGQYYQYYYGNGYSTGASTIRAFNGSNCLTDPTSSPDCVSFLGSYTSAMCSANPLYDPTCPGYSTAYLNQQCNANVHDDILKENGLKK